MGAAAAVTLRTSSGELLSEHPLSVLAHLRSDDLAPVRSPIAYKGQRHLPGYLWMSTLGRLVFYESRLEMVVLMQLDFELPLQAVVEQPFVLHYRSNGRTYRHTPDYLVWPRGGRPLLVNVKPKRFMLHERSQRAFFVCWDTCASLGWDYTTQCEPEPVRHANLSWLVGFRRRPPRFEQYSLELMERAVEPLPIGELVKAVGTAALVRPVLFHLLWTKRLSFDLNERLSDTTLVTVAG